MLSYPSVLSDTSGSSLKVAALGSNASFSCHGVGDIFWLINGVPMTPYNEDYFEQRGIIIHSDMNYGQFNGGSLTVNTSMNVLASVQNNNTNISCVAAGIGQGGGTFSENATLTVAGKKLWTSGQVVLVDKEFCTL